MPGVTPRSALLRFATLLTLAPSLFAAEYYVATTGDDSASGKLATPFRTIQKAANVAVAGDTVYIRGGTYRETVTPANSGASGLPITFQAYGTETVTISGTEPITGWTLDSGSIYQATMAGDFFNAANPASGDTATMFAPTVGNQADQVFYDGRMMVVARTPNSASGANDITALSYPPKSTVTTFVSKSTDAETYWTTAVFEDSALAQQAADYYKGAEVYVQPNKEAWSWTFSGYISASANATTGTRLTLKSLNDSGVDGDFSKYAIGSRYYLFNLKKLLDTAGEWYHDKTLNKLYLWAPGDANPDGKVEAKKRQFGFNLTDRSYITLRGLKFFACTVTTDAGAGTDAVGYDSTGASRTHWRSAGSVAASKFCTLENLTFDYPTHYTDVSGHFYLQWGQGSGVVVSGEDHLIRNCTIRYSAGNGISLLGRRNRAQNNLIEDTNYMATDCAGIHTGGAATSIDHEIAYNTIRRAGRAGIVPRGLTCSIPTDGTNTWKGRIHHNVVNEFGLQDWDCGGLYVAGNLGWTRIDHNLFYGAATNVDNRPGNGAFSVSGIYLDYSRNAIIDHNVIWDVEWGIHLQNVDTGSNGEFLCYNNTVRVKSTKTNNYGPFGFVENSSASYSSAVIRNNILYCSDGSSYYSAIDDFSSSTKSNNILWNNVANSSTDPKLQGGSTYPNAFFLTANSSLAINAGATIPSYTRDSKTIPAYNDPVAGSAPDIGAYEYGQPWVAGTAPMWVPGWPRWSTQGDGFNLYVKSGSTGTAYYVVLASGATAPTSTEVKAGTGSGGAAALTSGNIPFNADTEASAIVTGLANMATSTYDIYLVAQDNATVPNLHASVTKLVRPHAPAAPSALTFTDLASNRVTLNWTDNANSEAGFEIQRSFDGSSGWTDITTPPTQPTANTLTFTDTGLASTTTYYYRVRAYNAHSTSAWTTANTTTPAAPADVTSGIVGRWELNEATGTSAADSSGNNYSLGAAASSTFPAWSTSAKIGAAALDFDGTKAAGVTGTNLNLTTALTYALWLRPTDWSGNVVTMKGRWGWSRIWVLEKKGTSDFGFTFKDSGGTDREVKTTSLPPAGEWTHVAVTYDSSTGQAVLYYNGTQKASATFPANTVIKTNADGNTSEIRIGTSEGAGSFKGKLDSIRLYNRALSATEVADLARWSSAPLAPTGLSALAESPTQIRLTWTDNATDETHYKVERSTNGTSGWVQIAAPASGSTSYTDSPLPQGTTYYYRVRASNSGGNDSAYTSTASATTLLGDGVAPSWARGWPKAEADTATGLTLRAKADEAGTAYYVVLANGVSAPTSAQVKAGQDAANGAAIASGSLALSANTEASTTLSNLLSGTAYDVYIVAQDAAAPPNLQASPAKLDITTAPSPGANLIAYEAFDYNAGDTLSGKTGGSGWNNGWTVSAGSAPTIATTGLTLGSLRTLGLSATQNSASTANNVTRNFSAVQGASVTSSSPATLWISFLYKGNGSDSTDAYVGLTRDSGSDAVQFGRITGGTGLRLTSTVGTPTITGSTKTYDSTLRLVILRVDLSRSGTGTGTNTYTAYWWDYAAMPTSEPSVGTEQMKVVSGTAGSGTGIQGVRLYDGSSGANAQIDELRIGTTFTSVVPVADSIAPAWASGWPKADTTTTTGFTARAKADESGTAYYVVVADGAAAPTSAQVRAGNNASGSAALTSGTLTLSANIETATVITTLTSSTAYDVYFVAQDGAATPNLQNMPTKVDVTTSATARDLWRQTHFGTPINAGNAADDADPDHDGLSNLMEYALNGNPTSSTSAPKPTLGTTTLAGATHLTITFYRARSDVTYTVQATSDFTWSDLATNPGSVGESVTYTDSTAISSGSLRVLRLRVSSP